MQNKNNKRAEIIQNYLDTNETNQLKELFQQKQYQNLPVGLQDHFNRESKLSGWAILCWQLLQRLSFYDENWSVQISANALSDELGKDKRQILRLLKELEDSGYIVRENVKRGNVNLASRIYVRLPQHVIDILKEQPNRAKAIKKCGTVATNSNVIDVIRDSDINNIGGYDKNVMTNSNINNKIYNNTNTLASEESRTHSKPKCDSSVVVSICDDALEISRDSEQKISEIEKIKKCIDGWQQELDCLPKIDDINEAAKKYKLVRHIGKLQLWIQQYHDKLEALNKPLKQEYLQLSNGNRRLGRDNHEKLKKVLVQAVDSGKITKIEKKRILSSMVHSILYGYYCQENVGVAKSVNSVIKKFKNNEWNNSEINTKYRVSRPQPPIWRNGARVN